MAALLNVCFGLLPENAGEEESFEAFKLAEVNGTMVVDDMGKCTGVSGFLCVRRFPIFFHDDDDACGRGGKPRSLRFSKSLVGAFFASTGTAASMRRFRQLHSTRSAQ